MGIDMSGKMGMRCWTESGNGVEMGMIPHEWEGMRTTIVIHAHLYLECYFTEYP